MGSTFIFLGVRIFSRIIFSAEALSVEDDGYFSPTLEVSFVIASIGNAKDSPIKDRYDEFIETSSQPAAKSLDNVIENLNVSSDTVVNML